MTAQQVARLERERDKMREAVDRAEASLHHAGCEECVRNQEDLRAALQEASDA